MSIYDPIFIALELPNICIEYNYSDYISHTIQTPTAPVNKGVPMSEDQKIKLSIINTGKTLSEEHKRKIGLAGKGRPVSSNTREKISIANSNKSVSNETREKMKYAKLGKKKEQKICPYCNLAIAPNMYERWHNKNCKKYSDVQNLE